MIGTLMEYALPGAEHNPAPVTVTIDMPAPLNPLDAKGAGEAGCIWAPPAIVEVVQDALASLGITTIDMTLTPEKVKLMAYNATATSEVDIMHMKAICVITIFEKRRT